MEGRLKQDKKEELEATKEIKGMRTKSKDAKAKLANKRNSVDKLYKPSYCPIILNSSSIIWKATLEALEVEDEGNEAILVDNNIMPSA